MVVSIEAAVASVVLANWDDTLRIDDEGRWIESKRMLRELQAPHTSRAQLRQWCLLLVKLKAWWHSKQCGLAPSSIHGLAAMVHAGSGLPFEPLSCKKTRALCIPS